MICHAVPVPENTPTFGRDGPFSFGWGRAERGCFATFVCVSVVLYKLCFFLLCVYFTVRFPQVSFSPRAGEGGRGTPVNFSCVPGMVLNPVPI